MADNNEEVSNVHPEQEADIHVEPLVKLAPVEVQTGEADEEPILVLRAKLFRWGEGNAGLQWKDRGSGDMKLLKHKTTGLVRLVMRREKTLKLCANHVLSEEMELKTNLGCDRSWVYNVYVDFAEDTPRPETLAIRFKDSELAHQFKEAFEKAREANIALKKGQSTTPESKPASDGDAIAAEINKLSVEGKTDEQPAAEAKAEN